MVRPFVCCRCKVLRDKFVLIVRRRLGHGTLFFSLSTVLPTTPPRMPPTAAPMTPPFTLFLLAPAPMIAPATAPMAASRLVCFTVTTRPALRVPLLVERRVVDEVRRT